MNEPNAVKPSDKAMDDATPRRIPTYERLLGQSRKLGHLATRTLDATKDFLKKDVQVLKPKSPDLILFGRKVENLSNRIQTTPVPNIEGVVQRSHEILAGVKTVIMPANLFPDSVVVDRTKVTITKRSFIWSSQCITTRIEDILSVTSSIGPLFGSLIISTRVMNSTDHYEITYLWRKDAEYLKQIIQGYVIAQHNAIETKHLNRDQLVATLLELGQDSTV